MLGIAGSPEALIFLYTSCVCQNSGPFSSLSSGGWWFEITYCASVCRVNFVDQINSELMLIRGPREHVMANFLEC